MEKYIIKEINPLNKSQWVVCRRYSRSPNKKYLIFIRFNTIFKIKHHVRQRLPTCYCGFNDGRWPAIQSNPYIGKSADRQAETDHTTDTDSTDLKVSLFIPSHLTEPLLLLADSTQPTRNCPAQRTPLPLTQFLVLGL